MTGNKPGEKLNEKWETPLVRGGAQGHIATGNL